MTKEKSLKFLYSLIIFSILLCSSSAMAIVLGKEPPAEFIENLKSCKESSIILDNEIVEKYIIKGKTYDNKCIVEFTDYTNFEKESVYENYKKMAIGFAKSFGKELSPEDIPSQSEMIKQAQKEKSTYICKFTPEERTKLYIAYLKHDGNSVNSQKTKDGFHVSFDSTKMSSYENLIFLYQNTPSICKDLSQY